MSVHERRLPALIGHVVGALAMLWAGVAFGAELVIPGSSAPESVVAELARAFNKAQGVHKITVPPSIGVAGALREVGAGRYPMARIGRPLDEAEQRQGLRCMAFARDAVVFVAGAGVAVSGLTEAQLAGIFSGSIANWRGLGGLAAPIRVVVRRRGTVALNEIERRLPSFKNMAFAASAKTTQTDQQTVDLLDRFDQAVGWSLQSNLIHSKTRLRMLAVNAVEPTPANLGSGRYPLNVTSCFLQKDGLRDPAALAFLEFVYSGAGRAVIERLGLLAMPRPPA